MTQQRVGDHLGAAVWRGTRWGVLGLRRPAEAARASGDPVSIANARNAVNHAWTFAVGIVAVMLCVPLAVAAATAVFGPPAPEPWATALATVGALIGLGVGSMAHASRGVRAAERGEIHRAPQTIPFVR